MGKLISYLTLFLSSVVSVNGATITYSASYGLENILYTIFLLIHSILWFYIFTKTRPFVMEESQLLKSVINATTRGLSLVWLFTIFYMSRGILLISSSADFLESKLFIFNLLYYVTIFFIVVYLIIIFIKHQSKITGLSDFLSALAYEVKYGE